MSAFFITAFLSDILPPDEMVSEMRTMVMFSKNHSFLWKTLSMSFPIFNFPKNYVWCTAQHHHQTMSNMTQKMYNSTNSNVHKTWDKWLNAWKIDNTMRDDQRSHRLKKGITQFHSGTCTHLEENTTPFGSWIGWLETNILLVRAY